MTSTVEPKEMQRQDRERTAIHLCRLEFDAVLSRFNVLREQHGLGPVTILVPEERN